MMEFCYKLEDFKSRVDLSKPLHHDFWREPLDKEGMFHQLIFRIYGISKNGGHIIVYETRLNVSTLDVPKEYHKTGNAYENLRLWVKDLSEKISKEKAEPLGSTPGRWEP
jgi:hypothetical protein